jgi:hypothetical protein|nr:MAG TPA: hypothetical protein [Bacteriophage sp.]
MIIPAKISAKFMLFNQYTNKIYQKLKHEATQCLFHDAVFIAYQYDLEYQIYSMEVVKW